MMQRFGSDGRRGRCHSDYLFVATLISDLNGGSLANIGASLVDGFRTIGLDAELLVVHQPMYEHMLRYSEIRTRMVGATRSATSVRVLARYLRRFRPDVLLAQSAVQNVLAVAAARLARAGTSVVITEQTDLSIATARSTAANARMRLLPPLVRAAYPRAQGLVGVSARALADPFIAPLLTDLPNTLIGNPCTWDVTVRASAGRPHHWLATKHVEPTFVAVGRLVEGKGFPALVRAMGRLRDRGMAARLIILGEGNERETLARLTAELGLAGCIDLPGHASNPFPTVAAADVFVVSSALEGSSMALLEAMTLGRPIVATAAGGTTKEILASGKTGLVVPDGDVDALARALELLVSRPSLRDTLGRAARMASEDRRPERVARRYLDFFHSILDGGAHV